MISRLKKRQQMKDKERKMTTFARFFQPRTKTYRVLCMALWVFSSGVLTAQNTNHLVRNVVLVHGAWADGSGWKGVYDILTKDGYNVSIVQEPETSFKDDVEATKRVIAQQDGPCILVAHSYGGAVATEAGNDPSVVALVYVAAHMPDAGENEAEVGKRFPSDLSKSTGIKKTPDGFTFLDPAQFHEYFAADLPVNQAAFMARSQVPNFADNFKAVITAAAWRSKRSWMLVAGADRTINPELERWYAKRANSHTIEVPGASHAMYVSHPKEVAAAIEDAAAHAQIATNVDSNY
jgi:pimeloyl-ACP methyl ester carboxylesterase